MEATGQALVTGSLFAIETGQDSFFAFSGADEIFGSMTIVELDIDSCIITGRTIFSSIYFVSLYANVSEFNLSSSSTSSILYSNFESQA